MTIMTEKEVDLIDLHRETFRRHGMGPEDIDFSYVKSEAITAMATALTALERRTEQETAEAQKVEAAITVIRATYDAYGGRADTSVTFRLSDIGVLLAAHEAAVARARAAEDERDRWAARTSRAVSNFVKASDAVELRTTALKALRNVRMLAMRIRKSAPETSDHLLRFCAAAGVVGSVTRDGQAPEDGDG